MADHDERVLDNPATAYEREDLRLAVIGLVGVVIFALVLLVPLVLRGAYPSAVEDVDRRQAVVPPAPELQTDPPQDLRKFRAEEETRLNSYGWVDRGKGIVHIPIRQAMKEVAAHGVDGFPKAAP
ncbi:MAG TPA: hypothetical protein VF502_03185 [Stellaceae bacterium]